MLKPNTDLENTVSLLTFELAEQFYALPVQKVIRIIEMVTIKHLPGLAGSVKGIINLQGQPIPIIDMRQQFNLPPKAYGLHTPIILIELQKRQQVLGLVVDLVQDVVAVNHTNMKTVAADQQETDFHIHRQYLSGLVRLNRQIIPILNPDLLLTTAEMDELAQIAIHDNQEGIRAFDPTLSL
jgi:purine-binding chemotaxis protein CheW